jgi:hypothetical protein
MERNNHCPFSFEALSLEVAGNDTVLYLLVCAVAHNDEPILLAMGHIEKTKW